MARKLRSIFPSVPPSASSAQSAVTFHPHNPTHFLSRPSAKSTHSTWTANVQVTVLPSEP